MVTILIVCGIHASINFVKLTGHTIQNGSILDTGLLAVDLMNYLLLVFNTVKITRFEFVNTVAYCQYFE